MLIHVALPTREIDALGVPRLGRWPQPTDRRMRTRMSGGVGDSEPSSLPLSRSVVYQWVEATEKPGRFDHSPGLDPIEPICTCALGHVWRN